MLITESIQREPAVFKRAGRVEDFEAEALPHLNDLYRTATRMLGDSARAEDVVQETYLQAWQSFDRFEPGTNCRAWLFKILFHSVCHYRRQWFNLRAIKESEEVLDQAPAQPAVPRELSEKAVLAALDGLPSEFRSDVEEFSYKETAGILNIPIGTVMSRLSRGRKLLRDQLSGLAESYGIGKARREGQSA